MSAVTIAILVSFGADKRTMTPPSNHGVSWQGWWGRKKGAAPPPPPPPLGGKLSRIPMEDRFTNVVKFMDDSSLGTW